MIFRSRYQTFEFQTAREVRFGSIEDAISWLKHLGYPDPDVVRQMRDLVTAHSDDASDARLTDEQVLQRVAFLLYTQRVTVTSREHRTTSGQPAQPAAAAPAPAFPLSERTTRATPPPPPSDPPTFSPNNAAATQAAALVAAAAAGAPFCQECSKS
jgi:hypothetical protein